MKVSCAVLAFANPKEGKFNTANDLVQQFNLYPPILNRFDYVFLLIDRPEKVRDKEIANRMLKRENKKIVSTYNKKFLKQFFLFIRNQPAPLFSEEVGEYIQETYSNNRALNRLINPRFVETIINGAKACARLRLSQNVERKDVDRTLKILEETYFNIINLEVVKIQ